MSNQLGSGDPQSLDEKVKVLIDSRTLRDQMGNARRDRARAGFSLSEMVAKIEGIYLDCV